MCNSRCLYVVDPTSNLYTIDPVTASTRQVGLVGIQNVTDIAFHGPTLYGVSFGQFLRIDPDTGKGVVIGAIGGGFSTNGLAIASDGTIYAGTTGGQLIKFDQGTGAWQAVGNFGGGMTSSGYLAIDSYDNIYGALNSGGNVVLAQINRTANQAFPGAAGQAKAIGPTGLSTVYGLAFFNCRLFGTSGPGQLLTINVATGAATVIAKNNLNQWGLANKPCCGC